MKPPAPAVPDDVLEECCPWLRSALRALGMWGENPSQVSQVAASSFDWLRIAFGLVLLYDSWTSLSWPHKMEMSRFLALAPTSAWLSIIVAAASFTKVSLTASLLSGRGLRVMGWVGVIYGLVVWPAMEHGGDFGQEANDPGLGLPYIVVFLYVLGIERLQRIPGLANNELLALARVLFGLLWGYDALLKFEPYFLNHYLDYLTAAQKDNAGTWRGAYDHAWIAVGAAVGPRLVAFSVGVAEVALAASLISGRGLRVVGPIGLVLSFVIWTTTEEWGGPYSMGVAATMPMRLLGPAIIYMVGLGYVWVLYNPLELLRRGAAADTRHKAA